MVYNALHSAVGSGSSVQQMAEYLSTNILGEITELLPIVLPVIIGFIAFRKGYRFLKGTLRSA